jgi:hypothetical protein
MTGIRLTRPLAIASAGWRGSILVPATGPALPPIAAYCSSNVFAGTARRHSVESQPTASANLALSSAAAATVRTGAAQL